MITKVHIVKTCAKIVFNVEETKLHMLTHKIFWGVCQNQIRLMVVEHAKLNISLGIVNLA